MCHLPSACTHVTVLCPTLYVHLEPIFWCVLSCRYDERIDRVETRIAARLRDQLGTAKSANEMFRIFSRYNALFVRAHIRGAIREYQTQLIQRVKDDIETLHNKFKVRREEMGQRAWLMNVVKLPQFWSSSIIIDLRV